MSKRKKPKKSKPQFPPPMDLDDIPEEIIAEHLRELGENLQHSRIWGSAGGGLVKIEMDGIVHVTQCEVSPELLEKKDRELLEDLVVSACNDALEKVRVLVLSRLFLSEDEEDEDKSSLAAAFLQDEDLHAQLETPFTEFMDVLTELLRADEEEEEEKEPKPKRGKK